MSAPMPMCSCRVRSKPPACSSFPAADSGHRLNQASASLTARSCMRRKRFATVSSDSARGWDGNSHQKGRRQKAEALNRMRELATFLDFAVETAWQAGRLTLAHYQTGVPIERKADQSVVTI